jgi:hypothetical protein
MRLAPVLCALLATSGFGVAAAADVDPAELERSALEALVEQKAEGFQSVAGKIAELGAAQRRDLPLRVRTSAVEFRFRGEFPGPAIANVEYVISKAGDKDHETLLAVKPAELKRLHQLRDAMDKISRAGHRVRLEVRLLWNENGKAHAEDLEDILAPSSADSRAAFARQLKIDEAGIGAFNMTHDPSALPTKPQAAEVHVTVRVEK